MRRFPNIRAADSACVIVVVLALLALTETTLSTDKPNDATVKTASHVVESKNSSTHPPVNNQLPPCVPVEEDKHPNKNLNKNRNTNHDDYHGKGNRKPYGKNSKFHNTHDDTDDYDDDHLGGSHPTGADREGKYWLVPPFLIGASSIVIAYVAIHCLYTHCNCDDGRNAGGHRSNNAYPAKTTTVRRVHLATPAGAAGIAGQQGGQHHAPTIVLSNSESLRAVQNSSAPGGGAGGGTTGSRMVPYVSYDGAYGQTQLVEAQPFLIYESDFQDEEEEPPPERKKTGLLQIPQAIGRRLSQARLSFSSVGSTPRMEPRASICFVPVGRTLSDPSTGNISFSAADIATPLPASLLIHSSVINPLVGAPMVDPAAVVDAAAAASTPSDGAKEDAMIHSYCKTCGSCQPGSTAAIASAAANVTVSQETREPTATSEPVVTVVTDDPDASDHQQSPTTIVVTDATTTLDRKDMPTIVVVENIDKPADGSVTPNDSCSNKSFPT